MSDGNRRTGVVAATWSAIYVGVAAATLPAVLPVMVGVLSDSLSLGSVRAGYVTSANMLGVALGSVICTLAARRRSWQSLIRMGAGAMIGANLLSTSFATFLQIATLRLLSGLGEGVVAAVCYAAMGRSGWPARALAFYAAGQGLLGAIGMGIIPRVVSLAGWPWLFVLVSIVALPAFWLATRIETLRQRRTQDAASQTILPATRLSWYALFGIFLFAVGMSAVWAFVERVGHAKSIELNHLSISLSASAIANMAGSLLVGIIAHRWRAITGLVTGCLLALAGFAGLASSNDNWHLYLVAMALFFFSWGFYIPFQFRLLARVDAAGQRTLLIPLITGGGLALGPAIGGVLMDGGGTFALCVFGSVCVAASTASAIHLQHHLQGSCHE